MKTEPLQSKPISLFLAFLPLIVMAALVGVLNLWMGIDLKFVLVLSSIVAGIVAIANGTTLKTLLDDFAENVKKAFPAILILIAIGGIVGTWMYSGTVPYLIYYGLKFIHPDFVLVSAFVVTAIVSTFTGTSWGSAATAGVAFMGIGFSFDLPLEMVAGAVISGAVLGDKVSPISDTTNICATASGVTVYEHIRGMIPNVFIAGVLAIIGFTVLGIFLDPVQGESSSVTELLNQLDSIYTLNISMLIPPAIVFIGGYKGYQPVVIMIASSLAAILIGMFSNDFTLLQGSQAMVSGFETSMISEVTYLSEAVTNTLSRGMTLIQGSEVVVSGDLVLSETLNTLLNRGGFDGMMTGAVLYCILAIAFGSFLESSGALGRIMNALLGGVRSKFGLITTAFGAGATLNGVSGNAMFSILTVGQLFRPSFKDRGVPPTVLSRSMENSMTLLESLLPWHVTAIYMSATLGVTTFAYAPFALFNMIGIVLFFVLVGRDLKRKKY
ncbi:MAG: Na+/H+ antiporter NhaC family protein [Crocinitomicaceae bacterium]|nr:Na+/H+ antiporter NhaC family protein [Crocinitomicaceae bacterium]